VYTRQKPLRVRASTKRKTRNELPDTQRGYTMAKLVAMLTRFDRSPMGRRLARLIDDASKCGMPHVANAATKLRTRIVRRVIDRAV